MERPEIETFYLSDYGVSPQDGGWIPVVRQEYVDDLDSYCLYLENKLQRVKKVVTRQYNRLKDVKAENTRLRAQIDAIMGVS